MEVEVDVALAKLADDPHELLQAPPEPVDRPGGDEVDLAAHDRLEHGVERRTLAPALRPGDALVDVALDDLPQPKAGA